MPVCEVCGDEIDSVTRCRKCDILFCDECGSVEDRLCLFCAEELAMEEETDEEESDEKKENWNVV